jgi:metallo-beta-lactamase class B
VPLSNHPGFDGTVAKLKAKAAAPKRPNPFVSGQPVVDRAMRVLNTCARAQKARFLITAAGEGGGAHASATDADRAAHAEDHASAAGPARGPLDAAVPLPFPYSARADDHAGPRAHVAGPAAIAQALN